MPGIWVAVKATTSVSRVVPVDDVEVVEVAPGGAHDHDALQRSTQPFGSAALGEHGPGGFGFGR